MTSVLQRLQPGARVAVIRLRSLGDCVLTTPALHLLKLARPDLRIGVVVEPSFAPVFEGNDDLDGLIPPTAADIAKWRAELVLNLHGGNRSAQMTFASRAPLRAGFKHFRFSALYNVRIPRAQDILGIERKVHTAEHLASAVFYLGVARQEIPRARLFATSAVAPRGDFVVIHPLAATPEKTWPASNFLSVAEHLEREAGLEPVFIGGPGESLAEFSRYRCVSGAPLDEIKSLLAGASLFLGNDSGPAHMAAAFGLRVVVLFGPSDHEIWAPWKTEAVVLKSADIREIRTDAVIEALAGLPDAV
ncbi:MAG TPA: glycosyltransferase family 9 protein [Bryobacteraceae bacterium]|nr:glycosyltransferase family 9 protein [Bryobacteraceae bacterium]